MPRQFPNPHRPQGWSPRIFRRLPISTTAALIFTKAASRQKIGVQSGFVLSISSIFRISCSRSPPVRTILEIESIPRVFGAVLAAVHICLAAARIASWHAHCSSKRICLVPSCPPQLDGGIELRALCSGIFYLLATHIGLNSKENRLGTCRCAHGMSIDPTAGH